MWSTSSAVAAAVGEDTVAALHAERIEAHPAELQQLLAPGVTQLHCCAEAFGRLPTSDHAIDPAAGPSAGATKSTGAVRSPFQFTSVVASR